MTGFPGRLPQRHTPCQPTGRLSLLTLGPPLSIFPPLNSLASQGETGSTTHSPPISSELLPFSLTVGLSMPSSPFCLAPCPPLRLFLFSPLRQPDLLLKRMLLFFCDLRLFPLLLPRNSFSSFSWACLVCHSSCSIS